MGINPLPAIDAEAVAQSADPSLHRARPAPSAEGNPQPAPGRAPNQETAPPPVSAASAQLPEDEVQVQRDSENHGEIVIRYLDHSGDVILQVPSSQVLGMSRAIEQDLKEQAKARANSAEAPSQGGKRNAR
jgi:hypothetical protein